jgi:hypothetical protein
MEESKHTITLIGLEWDKENLANGYYTFDEANKLAKNNRKRLPTKREIKKLSELPHVWDEERKGMWFAEDEKNLKNPDKSLFFPADGHRDYSWDHIVHYRGMSGYYWSSTPWNSIIGHSLYFTSNYVHTTSNAYDIYGFNVRCVRKVKK